MDLSGRRVPDTKKCGDGSELKFTIITTFFLDLRLLLTKAYFTGNIMRRKLRKFRRRPRAGISLKNILGFPRQCKILDLPPLNPIVSLDSSKYIPT